MTKIDIFSGFLGAGKTTLIKKLISEAYKGEKLVLIENEFGQIGIDGGFLAEAGVNITEMNSGCICCSLVGDFSEALKKVIAEYTPDRVLIEPSGVGKLSDVIRAVTDADLTDVTLSGITAVVDAKKCKMYLKNFGEFFANQVSYAKTVVLSHVDGLSEEKIHACVHSLRELNEAATIVTTDWDELSGEQLLTAIEGEASLAHELEELLEDADICPECGHHHDHGHHHHEHEHEHEHHHEHVHDGECDCDCEHEHGHHHHEHDHDHEHHHEHEHGHHHDHGEECSCGCGHDHEHHHHHADEVFGSWGAEGARAYSEAEIADILEALQDETVYGMILRAKGIVPCTEGGWIHFDYVPGEPDIRKGSAAVTGRLCVIGSALNEEALKTLFVG